MKAFAISMVLVLACALGGCASWKTELEIDNFGTLTQSGRAVGNASIKAAVQDFDATFDKLPDEVHGTVESKQTVKGVQATITPEMIAGLAKLIALFL